MHTLEPAYQFRRLLLIRLEGLGALLFPVDVALVLHYALLVLVLLFSGTKLVLELCLFATKLVVELCLLAMQPLLVSGESRLLWNANGSRIYRVMSLKFSSSC